MLMRLLHRPNAEARFWRWFQVNSGRLFRFEEAQDVVFRDLSRALSRVHKSLCFEFGPDRNGVREFIISADGNKKAFLAVQALARAAPQLKEWLIIPFRPPKSLDQYPVLRYGEHRLTIDDVWFTHETVGEKVELVLYIRGLTKALQEDLGYASFLLLDMALGEFVVETRVGAITRLPLPDDPAAAGLLPFRKVVEVVALPHH